MCNTEALVVPVKVTEYGLTLELAKEKATSAHWEYTVKQLVEVVERYKRDKEALEGLMKLEHERWGKEVAERERLQEETVAQHSEICVLSAEILEMKPKEPNTNPDGWPSDEDLT